MSGTTLRGVFPEPKPVHKKNFIKENMRHIKEMQGLLPESGTDTKPLRDRQKPKPIKDVARQSSVNKSQSALNHIPLRSRVQKTETKKIETYVPKLHLEKNRGEPLNIKPHLPPAPLHSTEKYLHRAVQTDNQEDIQRLYKNGIIRYPSPSVVNALGKRLSSNQDRGDGSPMPQNVDELDDNMHLLDINNKNYIKENILALKNRTKNEKEEVKLSSHQKGVLPKYLRDRKEELTKQCELEPDCPDGHVLLPDEERKETLRVLRQSYADRIQELNSMPVRSDTLRMRRRKMELEEELKKIDEGIKVFQRPKVFVKVDA
ncbi:hypothetical protein PPYR_13291 [Photinus pyralis]|uniref:Enkurin domain-containing protein n=1 Tax=Photinus pyralis TaxID=7054 RepID=A0A1Y1NIL0_PHOPY|nr:enkurin domain-containing protein 1 [Photinus pyralis]KAB0793671.1 hypothetical protein PPYR_13291 [Photinus pyralis]